MTDTPLPASAASTPVPGDGSIFGPVHLTRTMIVIAGIACAVIFYYVAHWIGWPAEPGFGGSLAQPKMALGAFVVAIVLLVGCTLLSTTFVGGRWFLAGLMAATAGLSTWSVRGGTMTAVLFNAQNSGANRAVFFQMLGELIVFFGVIAALWNTIWSANAELMSVSLLTPEARAKQAARFRRMRYLGIIGPGCAVGGLPARAASEEEGRSTPAALVVQTAVMLILMMIFVVTPLKKQVLTSVFISGVIATAIAEFFFGDRSTGRWYWIAPLAVGIIGYIAAYISPSGLETGDLQGVFAPLARVLPLDYASMGCAGVLFGYWWMEPDKTAPEVDGEEKTSPPDSPAV